MPVVARPATAMAASGSPATALAYHSAWEASPPPAGRPGGPPATALAYHSAWKPSRSASSAWRTTPSTVAAPPVRPIRMAVPPSPSCHRCLSRVVLGGQRSAVGQVVVVAGAFDEALLPEEGRTQDGR